MSWFDDALDVADHVPVLRTLPRVGRAIHGMATGDERERDNSLAMLESQSSVLSLVPGVSNVLDGAQAVYHGGAAVYDGVHGDRNGAVAHGTQALWSGISAVTPLPLGIIDAAAGEMSAQSRALEDHEGGDCSEVPSGFSDILATFAVDATDAAFGPDDTNWIAPGDAPTGTRGGEIHAGLSALTGGMMQPVVDELSDPLARTLGADVDGQTATARQATRAVNARHNEEAREARETRERELRERNERFNAEVREQMPEPRAPEQVQVQLGGRSEAQVSILANQSGVPMNRLQTLGPDGRWVQNEEEIRRAEQIVRNRQNGLPDEGVTTIDVEQPAHRSRRRPRRAQADDGGGFLAPNGRWVSDNDPDAARLRRRYHR